MTVSTVGFDGTVTEAQWARLLALASPSYVDTGLNVTATGNTREVSVSLGSALVAGVLVESDAATVLTFAANGGSTNRVDLVVVEINWSTNAATVKVVQGLSATPPALTQTPGTLYQMPLAKVTVRPGVAVFLASDVEVCKPQSRRQWSERAVCTSQINPNSTSALDVPGLSITVPVSDSEATYIVTAVLDVRQMSGSSMATLVGELLIGGSVQSSQVIATLVDSQSSNPLGDCRGTFSQTWRVNGLGVGAKVFKMQAKLNAAGSYHVLSTHSTLTIQQVA